MKRRAAEAFLDHIAIDGAAPEPMSRQLFRALQKLILDGGLRPASKLPATRRFAEHLGISRNTVVTAFELLVAEGYVESRHGSGSFVAPALPAASLLGARRRIAPPRGTGGGEASPRLSQRGQGIRRLDFDQVPLVPPVFTPGIPALDRFPFEEWSRIVSRTGRRFGRELLYPGDPRGWRPLREAIAGYLGPARGVCCSADQVIILTSARQAVDLAARLLTDPGDAAWVEEPGYAETRAALAAAGLKLMRVPVDRDGMDTAAGRALAPAARLACVTPSHQYPLGAILSLSRRLDLLDWARDAGAFVLEDDYDGEFRYGGRPITALFGLDGGDRVVYVGTFSKVLFPSLRLAFMVCPAALVDAFAGARAQLDGHAGVPLQAAVAEFIETGYFAAHIRRMRALYKERQDALVGLAHRRLAGALEIVPAEAGLHLVGRLPPGIADAAVTDAAEGIGARPLSRYGGEPGGGASGGVSGLMLGYAAWDERALAAGVLRLAAALDRVGSGAVAATRLPQEAAARR